MSNTREQVEAYLQRRKGWQLKDADGGAGSKLAVAIGVSAGRLNAVLREMESEGVISRDMSARRTFAIRLNKPAVNGQEPAAESTDEDYVKLGLGVLQAASKALQEADELRAALDAQRKELVAVRSQLQAAELQNAALERQVKEAQAMAERVAANLPPEVKKDVRALLTKVKRLG